jgi:ABC-type phosphate transport system substrate-binding protein
METYMIKKTGLLMGLLFLGNSFAASAAMSVVVNKKNTAEIDEKVVQKIFLGKEKKFSNGDIAVPINLATNNVGRGVFDEQILGRSSSQVSAYWSKLVFTGKGVPPKEVENEADVLAAVEADINAIGYIDSTSVTAAVKVVISK